MIVSGLRGVVERRMPLLARIYRQVRDEVRYARLKAVRTPEGFLLQGDHSMETGTFEPEERRILRERLEDCDVFVDVGANIGFYSCMARQMGKHVVAVEPHQSNLRLLYRNLQANGWEDLEIWPVALAQRPGLLTLYGASTGASLVKGWAGISDAYRTVVPVSTLDDILASRFDGKRMLIKVDIEGAEFDLLQGATATIERHPRATWLVEITLSIHRAERNRRFVDTFDLFLSHDYRVETAVQPRRSVTREELCHWMENGVVPPTIGHNWLFTPRSA